MVATQRMCEHKIAAPTPAKASSRAQPALSYLWAHRCEPFVHRRRNMSQLFSKMVLGGALALLGAAPALAAKDLVIGVDSNMPHLDPANTNDTLSQSVERTIYQGLFGFDKDMKLIPALAEKVDADETATEFTFHLRHDVTFHDGTPFNADAVKVNLERVMNPE